MELAVVSLEPAPDGVHTGQVDTGQLSRVRDRLAGADWNAVVAEPAQMLPATQLAHHLVAETVVAARIDLEQLIADHPGKRLVVLCAAEPLRDLVSAVLDVPAAAVPLPQPFSLTRLRASRSGARSLLCLNDTLHLIDSDADERVNRGGSLVCD